MISNVRKRQGFYFFFAVDAEISIDVGGRAKRPVFVDNDIHKSEFLLCQAVNDTAFDAENLSVDCYSNKKQYYKKYKIF